MDGLPLSEPPEGVLAGESIPRENEKGDYYEVFIERTVAKLKERGEPWTEMSDSELRERAKRTLEKTKGTHE